MKNLKANETMQVSGGKSYVKFDNNTLSVYFSYERDSLSIVVNNRPLSFHMENDKIVCTYFDDQNVLHRATNTFEGCNTDWNFKLDLASLQ